VLRCGSRPALTGAGAGFSARTALLQAQRAVIAIIIDNNVIFMMFFITDVDVDVKKSKSLKSFKSFSDEAYGFITCGG
jgi:hypothetical protein